MVVRKTKTQQNWDFYDIEFDNENGKKLKILLGGNGNLYWCLDSDNKNDIDNSFEITKENMYIYDLFNNLYSDVANCEVYKMEEYELCENEDEERNAYLEEQRLNKLLVTSESYESLFIFDTISWHSDDCLYNKSNIVNIYKENDKFILMFDSNNTNIYGTPIEFSKYDSRYNPFNKVFFKMFEELQKYDKNYHQIHFEEIDYQKTKKLEMKLGA